MSSSTATINDRSHVRGDEGAPRVDLGSVDRTPFVRRVSWGAVIAGVVIATTVQLVFTMLGAGIGFAAIEPAVGDDPGTGMAIGAALWWLVTGLISLFFGGMVAGRLAGFPEVAESTIHGLAVWALTGVLGVFLLTSAAGTLVGGALGPVADGLASSQTARELMNGRDTGDWTSESATQRASRAMETNQAPSARETDESISDRNSGMASRNVTLSADEVQMARDAADKAADAVSTAALWSFVALLLGAVSASFGGMLTRPTVGRNRVVVVA